MPRCQTLGGGTKSPISQPNGRLSPNPPTPLTHEGELSWTESVSVTCQHGARELSHFNLRGGIRLRSYECRVATPPPHPGQRILRATIYLIIKRGRKVQDSQLVS